MVLGTRWRMMIRLSLAPTARAASTNSFSLRLRTTLRTILAVAIHETNVIKVTMRRFDPGSPSTVVAHGCFSGRSRMTINSTNKGSPRKRSVNRINPLSILPPLNPAKAPTAVPMRTAEIALARRNEQIESSVEDPGVEVTADGVGAEPELGIGWDQDLLAQPAVGGVDGLVLSVRGDEGGKHTCQGYEEQHHAGDHRGTVMPEATQCQLGWGPGYDRGTLELLGGSRFGRAAWDRVEEINQAGSSGPARHSVTSARRLKMITELTMMNIKGTSWGKSPLPRAVMR